MNEYAGYKSKCCKASVTFKEEGKFAAAKGFYCDKCEDYCEVVAPARVKPHQGIFTPDVIAPKAVAPTELAIRGILLGTVKLIVSKHIRAAKSEQASAALTELLKELDTLKS